MKKKLLSVLMCATMVSALVAGCGSKPAADSSTDTTKTTESATDSKTDTTKTDTATTDTAKADGNMSIYIVSKGFQHQYWQAVLKGAEEAAKELGVTIDFKGPDTESDIAQQVQMLNNALNNKPSAIGLAALDTEACLEAITKAQQANIPIIGFDSGVPGAPKDAIAANAATDNYAAGELAATETYKLLKDKIASATGTVRIGVMNQDATSESITSRGSGFIDKMKSLIEADGKVVSITGHDKWKNEAQNPNVIIDVAVPAQVTAELSAIDAQNLLNKSDTICIYGSNQHSGEGLINGDANLNKLGTSIIGVAFDSGKLIKSAVESGKLAGAVTQDPVAIGRNVVELAVKAAKGEKVADVDTGCKWYTKDNMKNDDIAPNLYD